MMLLVLLHWQHGRGGLDGVVSEKQPVVRNSKVVSPFPRLRYGYHPKHVIDLVDCEPDQAVVVVMAAVQEHTKVPTTEKAKHLVVWVSTTRMRRQGQGLAQSMLGIASMPYALIN